MRTDTGQVFHLDDYKPTDFLIPETHLDFALHPERTVVKSTLQIERRPGTPADVPLILDGDELKLVDIRIDGAAPLGDNTFLATPDRLEIRGLPASGRFTLEITTEVNPTTNRQLTGLYRSSNVYCTQCEAEGFRRITYFLDRPDLLSIYTVRIEADRKRGTSAPVEWQSQRQGHAHQRPALCGLARSAPEARLSVRARRRRSWGNPRYVHYRLRSPCRPRYLCRAWQGAARALRHGCAEALDEMG